jgi:hypothetical protein
MVCTESKSKNRTGPESHVIGGQSGRPKVFPAKGFFLDKGRYALMDPQGDRSGT